MVKSVLLILNPPYQKDNQREERSYSWAASHQGHEQDEWKPPVVLTQLDDKEQVIVREMLRQGTGALARNDDSVRGCADNLELETG